MDIGIGLDATLNLSFGEQAELSQEAARLGYTNIWTPEGAGQDSFQLCSHRWAASCQVTPGGLTTGIGVSPVLYRTPVAFAMSGGTVSQLTGGRFIMGIGAGGAYRPRTRRSLGLPRFSTLALMRDYLVTVRGLVAGEEVNYEGEVVTLRGVKLAITPPPRTPVYLGALGPEMLRLAGELADGVCLNWCSPEQIAWSRERIAEGAARVGRDPSRVKVAEYIRVCVDQDIDMARRAFARSTMGYALGQRVFRPNESGSWAITPILSAWASPRPWLSWIGCASGGQQPMRSRRPSLRSFSSAWAITARPRRPPGRFDAWPKGWTWRSSGWLPPGRASHRSGPCCKPAGLS
jgi:alkanesulfonate monooxygenase SsuD/methylene tetrahydromethanopterin reductase-like flavin-dependent oxidoreductase (luciferase family)